jgi:16S rRNA (uracil1498-N3)-methyltransferase
MAVHDAASQRVYVDSPLAERTEIACTRDQTNYLKTVLRVADGSRVLVFNGYDGEWSASLRYRGKRDVVLAVDARTRPQSAGPDLTYLFAPLKRSRLDYMVQKATEMGVARLSPVLTRRTIAERVNTDRMRANAIEAAEQCGVLRVPEVDEPLSFTKMLADWDEARPIIFCDEAASAGGSLVALAPVPRGPLAVLIGPEGGFAPEERAALLDRSYVTTLSLGPRIMRADTAAVAALALVNAVLGDWT